MKIITSTLLLLLGFNVFSQIKKYEVYTTVNSSVGNIAFTSQGDLVYSHHPFFDPDFRVVKYNPKNKTVTPFPNAEWNTPRATDDHYLSSVLGLEMIKTELFGCLIWG